MRFTARLCVPTGTRSHSALCDIANIFHNIKRIIKPSLQCLNEGIIIYTQSINYFYISVQITCVDVYVCVCYRTHIPHIKHTHL